MSLLLACIVSVGSMMCAGQVRTWCAIRTASAISQRAVSVRCVIGRSPLRRAVSAQLGLKAAVTHTCCQVCQSQQRLAGSAGRRDGRQARVGGVRGRAAL
jgi:hypothetical protein